MWYDFQEETVTCAVPGQLENIVARSKMGMVFVLSRCVSSIREPFWTQRKIVSILSGSKSFRSKVIKKW